MNIANEVFIFFEACILGAAFGLFYDVFRIIRLSFKNPKLLVFIEDVLYFSVLALASFIFIVVENDGYIRAFIILGELLGAILYFFTISIIIMKSANYIIKIVKKFLHTIYKITIKPFIKLYCYFMEKIKGLIVKLKNKPKNITSKSKIHLK